MYIHILTWERVVFFLRFIIYLIIHRDNASHSETKLAANTNSVLFDIHF